VEPDAATSSSIATRPGVTSPVAEVTIKGGRNNKRGAERRDGAPVVSQLSLNLEKSWMKAVWITPSATAAPPRRLSMSSSEPRCTSARPPRATPHLRPSGQAENLVSGGDELADNGGADEAGRAGHKDTHRQVLQMEWSLCRRVLYSVK